MALSHSPKIVTDGLVLCLDAGDRKSYSGSGTTWTDRSGQGNHGTLVNGVGYNSANGGSLSFDGVNDYVQIPNCIDIGAGFVGTIEGCFEGNGYIISNERPSTLFGEGFIRTGGASNLMYTINTRNSVPYVYNLIHSDTTNATNNYFSVSLNVPNLTSGTANMIGDFLLNGSVQNIVTSTVFSGSHHNSTKIDIGRLRNYNYSTRFFTGKIYFIRIYNRKLTEDEQIQNYTATKGRFGL